MGREIEELVQVAAVAVARLEDAMFGSANAVKETGVSASMQVDLALGMVRDERLAQDAKWGPQHHDSVEWAIILLEEFAEYAGEILPLCGPEDVSHGAWDLLKHVYDTENDAREWLEHHEWNGADDE